MSDRYALSTGRTVGIYTATEGRASQPGVFYELFIEVDTETGIAYTVAYGHAIEVDELSPWESDR